MAESGAAPIRCRPERSCEQFGELLAEAQQAEAREFSIENDVLKIDFTTRGGQVKGSP